MNRNQIHEDSQPNEHLRRRIGSNLPPAIRSSAPPAPPTRGNRPYRGRGGGFRGGHRGGPPTSAAHGSLRGGGRGGPPPNSRQSLPPRPSQTTQGQQWNTNNRPEPPKPSWTSHRPNHPKPEPRPELAPGPVAGPSNPSAPQTQPQSQAPAKRKRKWNRDPHRKHNRQQEKRRKLLPSKPSTDQPSIQPTHGDPTESTSPSTNPTIEQCISFPTETLHEVQVETRPSSSSSSHPTLLNLDPTNRGTLRISPLPSDCDSSHPLATANKTIWTARKRTELLRKGLSVTKIRIVDNALVVEWTCSVSPDAELVDWLKKQGELYFHPAPTQYRAPRTPSPMQTFDIQDSDSKPISLIPDNVTSHESLEAGPSAKRNQEQPHPATGTFSLLRSRPREIQVELDPDSLSAMGPLLKLEEKTQQLLVPLPLPSAGGIPIATAVSSPSREKRERSPSPGFHPSPLRQGTYRIPYLPPDCQINQLNYEENRQNWMAREKKKMINKGLTIQNSISSNDGLVFDWTSEVPLLPDTLLPCSDQDSEASLRPGNSKPIPIYSAPKPSTFDDSYEDLGSTRGSPPIDNESFFLNAQVSNAQVISPVSPSDHRTSGNRNDRPAPAVTRSTPSDTTKPSGRHLEDIDPSFTILRSSSSGIHSPTDIDTSRAAGSDIQSSSSGMEFRNDLINDRHTHVKHPDEARLPKINSVSGPATNGKSSTNSQAMLDDRETGSGSLLPKEKSPLLGSYSFVDVFVERVGKFLAQYFTSLGQGRLILDAVYADDAKLSIEVPPEFSQYMPHIPSGVCYGLRTITPVMNAFPSVLTTAFRDRSIDEKVTVLKTKEKKIALEVSCGIVACDVRALLDSSVKSELDLETKVWMGHEFVLDPSSDSLKIMFHKISLKFI